MDIEAADLADDAVVAAGVAGRPFHVAVVRPAGERRAGVDAAGISAVVESDVEPVAAGMFGVAAGVDQHVLVALVGALQAAQTADLVLDGGVLQQQRVAR